MKKEIMKYAGIGSRKTPEEFIDLFVNIANYLSDKAVLRSGGADGADSAFERGCDLGNGYKEIYLPFKNFNKNTSSLYNLPNLEQAKEIVKEIHPAWSKCSPFAKQAHTRNVYQILGQDLNTPVDFVLCWTEKGITKGGTATAINLAKSLDIPVFNAGKYNSALEFKKEFWSFLRKELLNRGILDE